MNYKDWYLVRLIKYNKFLFVILLVFCGLQQFFNQVGINSFPWFPYAMYSRIEYPPSTFKFNMIYVNNQPYNYLKLPFWSGIAVRRTSDYYFAIRRNVDPNANNINKRTRNLPEGMKKYLRKTLINTDSSIASYPQWLFKFTSNYEKEPIYQMLIVQEEFIYAGRLYKPVPGKKDTLLVIDNPSYD